MTEEEIKEMLKNIVKDAITTELDGLKGKDEKDKKEEVVVTDNPEEIKKKLKELEDKMKEINSKEKDSVINSLIESYGISKDDLPSNIDVNDIKKLENVLKKTRELKDEEKKALLTQEKIIEILSKDETLKNAIKMELSKNVGTDPKEKKSASLIDIIQGIAGKKI